MIRNVQAIVFVTDEFDEFEIPDDYQGAVTFTIEQADGSEKPTKFVYRKSDLVRSTEYVGLLEDVEADLIVGRKVIIDTQVLVPIVRNDLFMISKLVEISQSLNEIKAFHGKILTIVRCLNGRL